MIEYDVVHFEFDDLPGLKSLLNLFGKDGWELVHIEFKKEGYRAAIAIFRRSLALSGEGE